MPSSDESSHRLEKRQADSSANDDGTTVIPEAYDLTSHFHLNNSHLHLMVHWAGEGSDIMFCLARDQGEKERYFEIIFGNPNSFVTFQK